MSTFHSTPRFHSLFPFKKKHPSLPSTSTFQTVQPRAFPFHPNSPRSLFHSAKLEQINHLPLPLRQRIDQVSVPNLHFPYPELPYAPLPARPDDTFQQTTCAPPCIATFHDSNTSPPRLRPNPACPRHPAYRTHCLSQLKTAPPPPSPPRFHAKNTRSFAKPTPTSATCWTTRELFKKKPYLPPRIATFHD